MTFPRLPQEAGTGEAPMVGDHPALDLINTEARNHGRVVDYWATDADVYRWLGRQGFAPAAATGQDVPAGLLPRGRALRRAVRDLVSARKVGSQIEVDALNDYLRPYQTSLQLQRDGDGHFVLARIAHGDAASSLLGPLAEATARLMVEGDFSLVRQCEHPDCILWFYDRTKSHKRRWCSMAQCGNRNKATRFRKRNSEMQALETQ